MPWGINSVLTLLMLLLTALVCGGSAPTGTLPSKDRSWDSDDPAPDLYVEATYRKAVGPAQGLAASDPWTAPADAEAPPADDGAVDVAVADAYVTEPSDGGAAEDGLVEALLNELVGSASVADEGDPPPDPEPPGDEPPAGEDPPVDPEPPGGAHAEPQAAIEAVGTLLERQLGELSTMSRDELIADRYARFRRIGRFTTLDV